MRDILSLSQRLPVMKTDIFKEDFYNVGICCSLEFQLDYYEIIGQNRIDLAFNSPRCEQPI